MTEPLSSRSENELRLPGELVEKAMRALYERWPQYTGKRGTDSWRPKTYEECYGRSPLEHEDDAEEMRVALAAALSPLLRERDVEARVADSYKREAEQLRSRLEAAEAERDRLREALRVIRGPEGRGPYIDVYREAGGGYQGLQAIARAALTERRCPLHGEILPCPACRAGMRPKAVGGTRG